MDKRRFWIYMLAHWSIFVICNLELSYSQKARDFPTSYHGIWQGNLHIFSGKGKTMSVGMEIHIAPTDSAHRSTWTLVYKTDSTEDRRNYEIVTIDSETGHYVIDEKNSILLDAYLFEQTLCSRFSVNSSLLIINYHFESDHIRFEVFSGRSDNPQKTGEEVKDVESILSYPMGAMQRAILRKKK